MEFHGQIPILDNSIFREDLMKKCALLVFILSLSACAPVMAPQYSSLPSYPDSSVNKVMGETLIEDEINRRTRVGWRRKPIPKSWQVSLKNGIKDRLKDPSSAIFKPLSKPRYCYLYHAPMRGEPRLIDGWGGIVAVNAKNSFGGYAGYDTWLFVFADKELFLKNLRAQVNSLEEGKMIIEDIAHEGALEIKD